MKGKNFMHPQELANRLKSKHPPAILDVRSGLEFRSGHIPGAVHSPTIKILFRVARIPTDRNAELVITCEHGPRAQLAKGVLEFFGYRNITLLKGHMAVWRRDGLPLEK